MPHSTVTVCPIWCPGFAALALRLPLDPLTLVARGLCSWVPQMVPLGETVFGRLPPPGHRTDSRLKDTLYPFQEACCLSWSLACRHRSQVRHTEAYCSEGMEAGRCYLSLVTAHQYLPQKNVYTPLEPEFLRLPPRGHFWITWLWWPAGLLRAFPQAYLYLHPLKAAA